MKKVPIGLALRDRLGETGVHDLHDYLDEHLTASRVDVVNAITERLDTRLKDCATRDDIVRLERQVSDTKVELLRWSLVFWIAQVTTLMASLLLK